METIQKHTTAASEDGHDSAGDFNSLRDAVSDVVETHPAHVLTPNGVSRSVHYDPDTGKSTVVNFVNHKEYGGYASVHGIDEDPKKSNIVIQLPNQDAPDTLGTSPRISTDPGSVKGHVHTLRNSTIV